MNMIKTCSSVAKLEMCVINVVENITEEIEDAKKIKKNNLRPKKKSNLDFLNIVKFEDT